ncbi:hypothetical protein FSP39_023107 [Pinctada imbricata]|uniref:non-specific serine/threonine protein kinase n=1 Tax=Pinctada imbricata TaxID=66713 RepID=A0AA88XGR5_PINIB|nr:hypothetical protein FSP39_023107 [Pinctada imbricata]
MEVIGEYEYNKKDLIGHGAFAVVFKGRSRKTPDLPVAIKSITKKNLAKSQNLLSKEIKILKELSDLHHENVVALFDCKETTNHVYLVMEYCNGGDLADYLQAKGTLSEGTIATFLRQIAAAMKALNAKGIVHRDMKPQNILLCHSGKSNAPANEIRLKIADFGFARFLQDGVMAATLCGSPMYMAPEVIMSLQYDAKADLWSIGTIVFQCLTGKAPFQAQTPQQLKHFYEKHAELKPNIPKDTSAELRDLLLKMLKRNAKDRIEFEDFFVHPFLKPPSPVVASSPVPVPGKRASQGFSSESPTPPRCVSTSPLSGKVEYSTPPSRTLQTFKQEAITRQMSQEGEYLRVDRQTDTPRCNSPAEDFVLVPEGLPSDQSDNSDRGRAISAEDLRHYGDTPPPSLDSVTANIQSGNVAFRKTDEDISPSRPSTLPMPIQGSNQSEPIPVPSQVQAYRRIQSGSSPLSSPRKVAMDISPVGSNKNLAKAGMVTASPKGENKFAGPDIGSYSPPNVKFSIGTPPSVSSPWRRGSVGTSPGAQYGNQPTSGSPKRRASGSSPHYQYTVPGSLPAILDSPSHFARGRGSPSPDNMPHEPVAAPFGRTRPQTVPENLTNRQYNLAEINRVKRNLVEQGRCNTDPSVMGNYGGGSLLSQQLVKAALSTQQGLNQFEGQVMPFGSRTVNNDVITSPSRDYPMPLDNDRSGLYRRHSANSPSPPPNVMFAQSPPNMEGPVAFVAPGLAEETLMDDNHNETMAKLSFVHDLVNCIMELALSRGAPLNTFSESTNFKPNEALPAEQMPRFIEAQRHLEQLVLYVRALHLLSSSLQLARKEIKDERLQISNSLKDVLKQMNEKYHKCVSLCKHIQQRLGITIRNALTPQIVVATADKLIYNYAIEMCQTAVLDELFGNPQECFRRYQMAHILLHSLSQQAKNMTDKQLLNKYKDAVERRLSHIHTSHNYLQYEEAS